MMEIRNINEYEPKYWADGSLHWEEPRKHRPRGRIEIGDIILPSDYKIDKDVLEQSRAMYQHTKRMIPVYLSMYNVLIGGFEQYVLAQELGMKTIPFMRRNKARKNEHRKFLRTVYNKPVANKKYKLTATDGSNIYVTPGTYKKYQIIKQWARKNKCTVEVTPNGRLRVEQDGKYIYGVNSGIVIEIMYRKIMKMKTRSKK